MHDLDWHLEAARAANFISEHNFSAHRGAMRWRQRAVVAIFGNDGYAIDDRSKREVELVRQKLPVIRARELGFGVDSTKGYSWVMLTTLPEGANVKFLEWFVCDIGYECGFRSTRAPLPIADTTLAKHRVAQPDATDPFATNPLLPDFHVSLYAGLSPRSDRARRVGTALTR
jgi:hypothetical protein